MAEVYVKGTIAALNIVEGDTEKGHWVRQECVLQQMNGGRPIHFQVSGDQKIQAAQLQVGQSYVVRLYLESQEGKDKNGNPMWFDRFIYGGIMSDCHWQYSEMCMYNLRNPQFVQNFQAEQQRRYAAAQAQMGYQFQPQGGYAQQGGYPGGAQQGYYQPQQQYGGYAQQPQGAYQVQQPQNGMSQDEANRQGLPF